MLADGAAEGLDEGEITSGGETIPSLLAVAGVAMLCVCFLEVEG
jgi:hypothetical protein